MDHNNGVLFVCSHNSAHSQMAEGWLRHLVGDRTLAETGRDMSAKYKETSESRTGTESDAVLNRIALTDREWSQSKARRADLWLVVVGNIEIKPIARLIPDPTTALNAECRYQTSIAASWRATVAVA